MAAVALGQIGDLQAVPYLIPLLDHPDPIICSNVARALGQIGDRSAVKPMNDNNPEADANKGTFAGPGGVNPDRGVGENGRRSSVSSI